MAFDPNNPAAAGMVLTLDDEFNTMSVSNDGPVNHTTWSNHLWFEPQGETAPSRLSVSNGALNFVGGQGFGLSTIDSSGKGFSQKFGYFEARMWLPAGSGTWPSFWLMSTAHAFSGGPATELDILEGQGVAPNVYFSTLHLDSSNAIYRDQQNSNNTENVGVNTTAGYHRYGALWDPNSSIIQFYFDGKPVGTAAKYSDTDSSPMMMMISNGIGNMIGNNYGTPPAPDLMKVDYVRVFQFPSQNPTPVTPQPVSSPDGGGQFPSGYGSTSSTAATTPAATTAAAAPVVAPVVTPPPVVAAPVIAGSPQSINVHVSGDHYAGNPTFSLTVDGAVIASAVPVTAVHSTGQWQDISIPATLTAGNHSVVITYANDANDGSGIWPPEGHDRNLYVGYVDVLGQRYYGNTFADTASGGFGAIDPSSAVMIRNGTASFQTQATTVRVTVHVSGDHYLGNPTFALTIDGSQVGAVQSVSADHTAGQWQDISFDVPAIAGAHTIAVNYNNDANDHSGSWPPDGHDRNLYVGYVDVAGVRHLGNTFADNASMGCQNIDENAAVMVANGTASFSASFSQTSSLETTLPHYADAHFDLLALDLIRGGEGWGADLTTAPALDHIADAMIMDGIWAGAADPAMHMLLADHVIV